MKSELELFLVVSISFEIIYMLVYQLNYHNVKIPCIISYHQVLIKSSKSRFMDVQIKEVHNRKYVDTEKNGTRQAISWGL